jgi:hypothetical protein
MLYNDEDEEQKENAKTGSYVGENNILDQGKLTASQIQFSKVFLESTEEEEQSEKPFKLIYQPGYTGKPAALIEALQKHHFKTYFKSIGYIAVSFMIFVPFYLPIPYMLNGVHIQAQKYMPQYQTSFVFYQQLFPLLSNFVCVLLIKHTGYNFPVMIYVLMTIAAGIFNMILESGTTVSTWEIVLTDQFARWAFSGINFFIVFWATNFKNFGAKNGTLGLVYLTAVDAFLGFAEWAWSRWDDKFTNWWLRIIGGKTSEWDATILACVAIIGWLFSIWAQKMVRANQN